MVRSEVSDAISEFASAFDAIPEIPEPPHTTLEVLRVQTGEKYWHRMLRYFLDPTAPHGLGTDFLEAFLRLVDEELDEVGLSETDLHAVQVDSEIRSDDGRPDLLIYVEDEWFVCIELKVTAPETGVQTKRYAKASKLGDVSVADYREQERHYVYLAKQTHADPTSEAFVQLCWSDVQRAMDQVITDSRGQYPIRTTSQMTDFRDTIRKETMSEQPHETQQREYVELYLEHAEAIDSVRTAFDEMIDREVDEWAHQFPEHYRPKSWDETWNCGHGKYGKIYRDSWRRDEDGNLVESWSDATFRLEFRHRIRDEKSWKDGQVVFKTVIPKNSDTEYRKRCQELFNENLEELNGKTESTQISIIGNRRNLTEATYSFDPNTGPDGYYATLADAFDEHMVLVPMLTEVYEDAYTNFL